MIPPVARAVRRRLGVALVAALVATVAPPAPSMADHGGRDIQSFLPCDRPDVDPPRCASVGDSPLHLVAFDESLTDGLASSLRDSMAEDYDAPTQLVLIEQGRRTLATDLIAYSADYGDNGAAGWVYCPTGAAQGINASGDRWCRQQEMHLNLNPRYGLFFDDDASRDHVVCHEIGHSLGLLHWGNPPESDPPFAATCMNANTPNGPTSLHPNDIDHINAYDYAIHRTTRPAGVRVVRRTAPDHDGLAVTPLGGLVDATGTEAPRTLASLVGTADATVHGTVRSVRPGRTFGPPNRPLPYAEVRVEVLELLRGRLPAAHAGELVVEIPLFEGPDALRDLREGILGTDRILFLRNKGTSARLAGLPADAQEADADWYRLVTFGSEIVERGGRAVVPGDEGVLAELHGLSFGRALGVVRATRPEDR